MAKVRVREYAGPLGVLAAGVVGFGLLCGVSALAMSDLSNHHLKAAEPLNVMDLAIANLSTSAALTQQAVTAFMSTPTVVAADLASLTPLPSDTPIAPASSTPRQPTRTRRPRPPATARPLPTPTRIAPPAATNTPLPPTDTLPPPPTDTESPPTSIPLPPPTDTELPPPTDPPVQNINPTLTMSP